MRVHTNTCPHASIRQLHGTCAVAARNILYHPEPAQTRAKNNEPSCSKHTQVSARHSDNRAKKDTHFSPSRHRPLWRSFGRQCKTAKVLAILPTNAGPFIANSTPTLVRLRAIQPDARHQPTAKSTRRGLHASTQVQQPVA